MVDCSHDRAAQQGFTLIEVLAALAILGIAFGYAFSAISDSVGSLASARKEHEAVRIADDLLARLGHDLPVVAGHTSGADGQTTWSLEIDPESTDPVPTPSLSAHAVTLVVGWQDGDQHRQLRLRSVRLGPRDAP